MAATAAIIAGTVQAGTSIWDSFNQNSANSQNFAAQQSQQKMVTQMIQGLMQGGQNPYAGGYLNMLNSLGAGNPGSMNPGTGMAPVPSTPTLTGPVNDTNGWQQTIFNLFGDKLGRNPTQAEMDKYLIMMGNSSNDAVGAAIAKEPKVPPPPMPSSTASTGSVPWTGTQPTITAGHFPTLPPGAPPNPGTPGGAPNPATAPISTPQPFNPLEAMLSQAFGYQANQLGAAPSVTGQPGITAQQVTPGQVGSAPTIAGIIPYQAQQINPLDQLGSGAPLSADQISGPNALNLPTINAPAAVSTQAFNPGQDALMQMISKDINVPGSTELNANLNNIAQGGGQYDLSPMFAALQGQDEFNTQKQVDQLHAGATDLGKRFGTAMNQNEALLRSQIQNGINLRNAQISQASFENAMNRRLQGTSTQAAYQQSLNQLPFQSAQLQQQAAGTAGSLFNQGQGLSLQAQTTNAGNAFQAQTANLNALLSARLQEQQLGQQAQTANQAANLQAGQFNTNTAQQAGQFNISNALAAAQANQQASVQAALAGQGINAQFSQQNAGNQLAFQQQLLQALQGNQQANLSAQTSGAANWLQAALANQGLAGQYGLANQASANAAGQFNANMGLQTASFNAQQGSEYNSLIQSILGQAQGAQQWQSQYNAGLAGLLAGQPIPQLQPNAIPGGLGGAGNSILSTLLLSKYLGGK